MVTSNVHKNKKKGALRIGLTLKSFSLGDEEFSMALFDEIQNNDDNDNLKPGQFVQVKSVVHFGIITKVDGNTVTVSSFDDDDKDWEPTSYQRSQVKEIKRQEA